MGNYKNIETEFIERTLELISQYEIKMHDYEFEKQFNHTLLINCLLGLIVLPSAKTISFFPRQILDEKIKVEMGIINSVFNPEITELKKLIGELRNSLAHFDIICESCDENFLIDKIIFKDRQKTEDYKVAEFVPNELLGFIRYYSGWVLHNIKNFGQTKEMNNK